MRTPEEVRELIEEALVLQLAARSLEEKLMRKLADEVADKELK